MDLRSTTYTEMRAQGRHSRLALIAACCGIAASAHADPTAQTSSGLPPQIIPSAPEVGVTIMDLPGAGNTRGIGSTTGGGTTSTGGGSSTGSGDAYAAMMATSYGSQASQAASAAGISADALAAIGQAESGFQNIPTTNGSSTATGPWQVTAGTFMQYSNQNNLGYTAADMTNPADEAQVASYIISSYANTGSQTTNAPATVVQTYGAYVFGPSAGSAIATANASEPLSNYVSSQALANNNMQNWTVGQFDSVMSSRLGPAANEPVTTTA
jgi:hypothetical protein